MEINATLIGQLITFALLVWFTMKYVWPPITKAMLEREKKIAAGLEATERSKRELDMAEHKALNIIRDAKLEASQIIEQAHKRSGQLLDDAKENARIEAKLYSYKVDPRSGDVLPIVVDKHNHLIDALRYALEPMMKKQMRMTMFKGIDGMTRPICPVCQSYLPDDGLCLSCGHDEQLDAIADPTVAIPEPIPESIFVHTNGNGNGNGHHTPTPSRMAKFRGLNR